MNGLSVLWVLWHSPFIWWMLWPKDNLEKLIQQKSWIQLTMRCFRMSRQFLSCSSLLCKKFEAKTHQHLCKKPYKFTEWLLLFSLSVYEIVHSLIQWVSFMLWLGHTKLKENLEKPKYQQKSWIRLGLLNLTTYT